jgi:diguanylate cyclase (GGDEF)-like protein
MHGWTSQVEERAYDLSRRWSGEGLPSDKTRLVEALARQIDASHPLIISVLSIAGEVDLGRLENAFDQYVSQVQQQFELVRAALETLEERQALTAVETDFATLKARIHGSGGFLSTKSEALVGAAIFAARSKKLNEIETRYTEMLTGVAGTVRNRNEASQTQTAHTIAEGRTAVLGLMAIATLMAFAAAGFLILSISRPVERLTAHMQNLRRHGELIAVSDPALLTSADELGDLSRMFNGVIMELAEARRQLIAKSEAEISKQADRLQAAVSNMSQGLCMFDQEQRLIISNPRYSEIYGIPLEKIVPGMSLRRIMELRLECGGYHGDAETYITRRLAVNRDNEAAHSIVELHNGRIVQLVRKPLKNGGWVSTHEDITERRQIEAKIAHMAHHDVLTNLPNRVLFREKMEEGLVRVSRGEMLAVLCLDLDHFKAVNDTLGHSMGDALLRAVSERLLNCIRDLDTIARLGGDEFAIIQIAPAEPHEAAALAERIIETIAAPFSLEGHQIGIGTSVGIALAPSDGVLGEELLQKADLALYRAKMDGRNTFRFFEPGMDAQMQEWRAIEVDLRNALAANQFELYYQPLVTMESGRITGFEALLRWHHPQRGLVPPGDFIPLAEEVGLVVPIGEWVLQQACREAASWPGNVHVAVNLSPAQFRSRNLLPAITLALANSGLDPSRLELEITESVLLYENQSTLTTLSQIKALGVRIAMDDFGTGYSSLSYLRSFPFDKIKIDRSFIRDLANSEDCVAIVRAVTSLGASLGMKTIAEGVETVEQMERLRLEGCEEVQGFLISPPRPVSELGPMLDELRNDAAA